jgi:hypothetical protein
MLARQIKRQTVPVYLRWLPDAFFPHIDAAVARAQSEDGAMDCHSRRTGSRSTWSFIMPFDLEHYIEDHSTSGEHLPR